MKTKTVVSLFGLSFVAVLLYTLTEGAHIVPHKDDRGTVLSETELADLSARGHSGDFEAMRRLRLHYDYVEDKTSYFFWLRQAAEFGDRSGMVTLGHKLCASDSFDAKQQGWEWLVRAEKEGYADATSNRAGKLCFSELHSPKKLQ